MPGKDEREDSLCPINLRVTKGEGAGGANDYSPDRNSCNRDGRGVKGEWGSGTDGVVATFPGWECSGAQHANSQGSLRV